MMGAHLFDQDKNGGVDEEEIKRMLKWFYDDASYADELFL